ncbi:hypothetical protein AB0C59_17405 [Streptomyces sp. NPDC048664]|uniref:hypothetical protein n=1 Tax=Streptomyces sp. NPDC048664 TaxID=3154505 RepID=UPI003422B9D2
MPAVTASALLLASGCSSGPGTSNTSGPAPAGTSEASVAPDESSDSLAVAAAPDGTPTAVARSGESGGHAHRSALKVNSYDRHTRRAVISGTPAGRGTATPVPPSAPPSATPSNEPTAAPSSPTPSTPSTSPGTPDPHRPVAVGDVIASAPAPGAPQGLLAKVTQVIGAKGNGTEVQTAPTTLDTLLGADKAKGAVPVDPASFDVQRLLPDVQVSWAKTGDLRSGPEGAKLPLGSLRVDVKAAVPTPKGSPVSADATVDGFVQVAPEVDFSYGGGGAGAAAGRSGPASAYLGVSGDWTSRWSLKGRAAASTTPVRLPFAKLHADPVLKVGPIPVVVNLDLTCYFEVSADGKVTVSVEQDLKGAFKAGGTFGLGKGWSPVNESTMTGTPVRASVTAEGHVKAALGAEASVGLYGAVGVTADLAPYLRGDAAGSATAAVDAHGRPSSGFSGSWAVYGGVDLSGVLELHLSIFGTPVLRHTVPLGTLHREWKLAASPA